METFVLGMSEKAFEAITSNQATRKGGVVYWNHGGILEHLIDADIQKGSEQVRALCGSSVVPFAVLGVSMLAINVRLEKIEVALRQMQSAIDKIMARTELSNLQATGHLIGRLRGTLYACHLDLQVSRMVSLAGYRKDLLEAYYSLREVANGIAGNPELLRQFVDVFHQYSQYMFLAGIAARDVTYRLGEEGAAKNLSYNIAAHSIALDGSLRSTLIQPSALFWRENNHITVALETRESAARLNSHAESLRWMSKKDIHTLVSSQIDT